MTIGNVYTTTSLATVGALFDDIRIYDTALTASEIFTIAGIPEPSAITLLALGGGFLLLLRRRF